MPGRMLAMVAVPAALLALPAALAATAPPTTVPPTTVPPPPTTAPPVDQVPVDEAPADVSGGSEEQTPVTLPVVPVPPGCEAPPLPHIVFVGTVVERDYRTVRFEIEQIRSGRPDPFADGDRIDVRYGLDAQYLDDGARYLVSAPVDPALGLLVSRVTEPVEDFGGDEVIGVSESDVTCPRYDDPIRTLHVDGMPIDAGLLDPLDGARPRILGAILLPLAVGFAVIFLLAMLRLSVTGVARSIADATRPRA